ncbi:UNVERIFIED_CONTAM: hypothetical protein Slati_1000600 [Sesamum latifolium]|uniref:Uncharacterized protein n=1 Tax=Sesamum latifolium TaxID=2727402 RepID=A0AAW2XU38_9LAMI
MQCVNSILQVFGKASGQEVNLAESVVVFSKNTPMQIRKDISEGLGIRSANKHEKYLGLPSVIGRSKKEVFSFIRDKIWSRINNWNERQLSQAGKEILIKAVLQTIPTYAMGVFRLPDGLIQDIEGMIARFWWNSCNALDQGSRHGHATKLIALIA